MIDKELSVDTGEKPVGIRCGAVKEEGAAELGVSNVGDWRAGHDVLRTSLQKTEWDIRKGKV